MAIVTRHYILDGALGLAQLTKRLPTGSIIAALEIAQTNTSAVISYDDTTLDVVDLDSSMAVFGYVPGDTGTVTVRALSDFPTPVAGVITLAARTTYAIGGVIDIAPNVLLLSDGTTIMGTNAATDRIVSHQAAAVLQVNAAPASDEIAIVQGVQIINGAGDCVDFQGDAFVFMSEVGLAGASAGRVSGIKRFAFADSVLQRIDAGFRLEGANGSVVFSRLQAYGLGVGVTLLQCAAPATVNMLQLDNSNVIFTDAAQIAFDLDEAIAAAADACGIFSNLFTGPGTPLATGVGKAAPATSPNPPWLFRSNIGIADTP